MTKDLTAARDAMLQGRLRAVDALAVSLASADAPANLHTYTWRFDNQAMATAQAVDATFAAGAPLPRLGGLAISVKALFDVQGQITTAASRVLADAPAAASADGAFILANRRIAATK